VTGDAAERAEAVRERAAAATGGPWEATSPPTSHWYVFRGPVPGPGASEDERQRWARGPDPFICDVRTHDGAADAAFIAHAREDIPWLLDQLDRSVSREAAALATPPGRAARLEALAVAAHNYELAMTTEEGIVTARHDLWDALAALGATGLEAPHG
jgi:hypothetical protein